MVDAPGDVQTANQKDVQEVFYHVLDVFLLHRDGRRGLREEEDGVLGRDDHLGEAVHRPQGAVSLVCVLARH